MAKKVKTSTNQKELIKKVFKNIGLIVLVVGLAYGFVKMFVAAYVNGRLISRLSVVRELEKQGGKKTLDALIIKSLIAQEAKKRKITVTQSEIDTELKKVEDNVKAQGVDLETVLKEEGMSKSDLIEEIKIQVKVTKMVEKNIKVTDKEIEDYIASQKEQLALLQQESPSEVSKTEAASQLKAQKLQKEIQTLIADLKAKAKIKYFMNY